MASKIVHFYFDFISPFAYFAWLKLPALAKKHKYKIEAHPVVFGKLLDKWGQLGPAQIPPKQKWFTEYCIRYAALNGFKYNPPKKHPFNPLPALRMSLKEVSSTKQTQVINTIFNAGWSQGHDLGDLQTLVSILEGKSINGQALKQQIFKSEVKQLLINETNNAIKNGVFGVPTIIINDKLFWGNDQMEHIELMLNGEDPLDEKKMNAFINRPRAIDRLRFNNMKTNKK